MAKKLPTVNELVQVFIDNGWKGKPNSDGCTKYHIEKGECCIIPALIKYAGEEFDYTGEGHLYRQVEKIYNIKDYELYSGFDSKYGNSQAGNLAKKLRIKLEKLGMMA